MARGFRTRSPSHPAGAGRRPGSLRGPAQVARPACVCHHRQLSQAQAGRRRPSSGRLSKSLPGYPAVSTGGRNAMSVEMRDALVEALQLVVTDASIRRARFAGAGACFSIGGDLREFGTASDPASAHAVRSVRLPAAVLIHCAARTEFHLHSACIGAGIELPAFAGRVTAAPNAFFQLPEIRFGLIPGAGGCVSLPRRIGRQRTAFLALSTRRINATTALDWGLIDEILD